MNKYTAEWDQYSLPNVVRLLIIAEYFPELFQLLLGDTRYYHEQIQDLIQLKDADPGKHQRIFPERTLMGIREFEDMTGVRVAGIFPQLTRMRNLFEGLHEQQDLNKPHLPAHVQAVFSITRLI